jgi:hypothetical protein
MRYCTFLIFISIIFNNSLIAQKRIYTTSKIRVNTPKIDGIFDDPAWQNANWDSSFVQHLPREGEPATQRTAFKVIYDENNIYFAVRCFDTAPDSIVKRMARRDGDEGDWVKIMIDSYHDLRTAFSFGVSVAGVKIDEMITNDASFDASWNPIWYAKTSIDSLGWTVEACIPFSELRFGKQDEYVWGLEIGRRLYRKEEISLWQFVSPTAPGYVHLFGELHGIRDIIPKKQREIVPYIAAAIDSYQPDHENPFADGRDYRGNIGLDGKFGITNDLTLDMTINPDFGQVEADPSEVNLTTFETKFSEKRPFFIEGKNILSFNILNGGGPLYNDNLFYSRRIGKTPSYSSDLADNEYIKSPINTSILGAFKLTGRTRKGWSVGVLESLTQKEHAEIDSAGKRRSITVEPLTNYFTACVLKDMNNSNTQIGVMATAVNRDLSDPELASFMHKQAYTAGMSLFHQWKDKTYYVNFITAYSYVEGTQEAIYNTQTSSPHYFQRPGTDYLKLDSTRRYLNGLGGTLQAGKAGNGKWMYTCWITYRSPGFNLNDMGYLNRNDEIQEVAWAGYRQRKPFSVFREFNLNFNQWYATTFGLDERYIGGNAEAYWIFKNYWDVTMGFTRDGKSISTETLRGGPALFYEGDMYYYGHIGTDHRKKIQLYAYSDLFIRDHNTGLAQNYSLGIVIRPSDALSITIEPSFSNRYDKNERVGTPDSIDNSKYIRGSIYQKTLLATVRLSYNISPDFTVEFYGMPFISAGKYSEFKYISNASAADFNKRCVTYAADQISYDEQNEIYDVDENRDGIVDVRFDQPNFNVFDFNSNLVLRWEFRPGSTLYLVWSQNRNKYLNTGYFQPWNDTKTLFGEIYPHDIFLIKFAYRFGL